MILLNVLLNQQIPVNCRKDFDASNIIKNNIQNNSTSVIYKHKFMYFNKRNISPPLILLSSSNVQKKLHNQNLIQHSMLQDLFVHNFFSRFINQYWKEVIFLSVPNESTKIKMRQMQANQLSLHSHEYKNFLKDFSKALANGRINVIMNLDKNLISINEYHLDRFNQSWKVVWKKGFNIINYADAFISFILYIKSYMPDIQYNKVIRFINSKSLPLFAVVNDFNQLVLAESSIKMLSSDNFIDSIMKTYKSILKYDNRLEDQYLALFFVNPHDAKEYSDTINMKYNYLTNQSIKLFPAQLSLYYKLSYIYKNKNIDFRLIPDLKEVSLLIRKYQYHKNVSFQSKQKYGSDFFQGQPIYRIKPVIALNQQNKQKFLLHYSYNIMRHQKEVEYDVMFLNYETAIHAWSKFKKQMVNYKLPNQPELEIFNLESFLKTCEQDKIDRKNKIIFIPSRESYQYIKSNMKLVSQLSILQKLINKYVFIKIITQRVIWSLTSRQPINW